MNIQGKN